MVWAVSPVFGCWSAWRGFERRSILAARFSMLSTEVLTLTKEVIRESLPDTSSLLIEQDSGVLFVRFNRPEKRNALNKALVDDIIALFQHIYDDRTIRAVVLRGAGGHFCAGGDIEGMQDNVTAADQQAMIREGNRRFGELSLCISRAPQVVIALLEGAVLGGGFGMACVSDIAIADKNAKLGMPETRLGLVPAQIAPFVLQRIGLTQARKLALLGERINGEQAQQLGLVHCVTDGIEAMDAQLQQVLTQLKRCGPGANARTKQLFNALGPFANDVDTNTILDRAADAFTASLLSEEGAEGTRAFVEKRAATWVGE